ncbi:MAG: hypothetical protein R2746_12010 [Acidimicrobiales bacterium]
MVEVEVYRLLAERAVGRRVAKVEAPDAWFLKGGLSPDQVTSAVEGATIVGTARGQAPAGAPRWPPARAGTAVRDDRPAGARRRVAHRPADLRVRPGPGGVGPVRPRVRRRRPPAAVGPRRLGAVELDPDLDALGPGAWTITLRQLRSALAGSTAPLKARLLDQSRVAGLGNLLVDEALWRVGLDPARPPAGSTRAKLARLHRRVRATVSGRSTAVAPTPATSWANAIGRHLPPRRRPAAAAHHRRSHHLLLPGPPAVTATPGGGAASGCGGARYDQAPWPPCTPVPLRPGPDLAPPWLVACSLRSRRWCCSCCCRRWRRRRRPAPCDRRRIRCHHHPGPRHRRHHHRPGVHHRHAHHGRRTHHERGRGTTGAGSKRVADENRKIWAVVGGLVFVALALTLLTIRYWRKTRPVPVDVPAMVPADAATAAALTATPEPATAEGGPATEPVPAVPAVAVEPTTSPAGDAATDAAVPEVDEPAPAAALEGPASPWAPAAGAGAAASAIDPIEETGDETAPVPVVDAPAVEPAAARRAVAGADHAAADEAWEPRGTGEHERVVVAPASRPRRLTPEQRAALFARRSSDQP